MSKALGAAALVVIAGIVGAGWYGWETIQGLHDELKATNGEVDSLDTQILGLRGSVELLETLLADQPTEVSRADINDLRQRIDSIRHDVDLLRIDLDAARGTEGFWHPANRNLIELDTAVALVDGTLLELRQALDAVEGCLGSLISIIDGFGSSLSLDCSRLPPF